MIYTSQGLMTPADVAEAIRNAGGEPEPRCYNCETLLTEHGDCPYGCPKHLWKSCGFQDDYVSEAHHGMGCEF